MPAGEQRTTTRLQRLVRSLAGLSVLLGACGSIGDPLPPLANLPRPIGDLVAQQITDEIIIHWSWPLYTTENTIARRPGGFTLWAMDLPSFSADLPPETIDEYRQEVVVLEADELAGSEPGERLQVTVPLREWRLNQRTILVVTAWNRAGRDAGYSNQVRLQPLEPPARVVWIDPEVVPEGVSLTWRPAERADQYQLERASGQEPEFATLGRVAETSFVDSSIRWGATYVYRLRSYRGSEAGWVEGSLSETVAVTATDSFAPTAPDGLRAVRTTTSVELSWLANREQDLAGYRIFRDGISLTPVVARTSYSDVSAAPDRAYEYALTAVDANGNESQHGPSLTVPAAPADEPDSLAPAGPRMD